MRALTKCEKRKSRELSNAIWGLPTIQGEVNEGDRGIIETVGE